MTISGIGSYGNTVLAQSIRNIKSQFTDLQSQLATGEKSTTYSGMGLNEGFAVAARAQLSNITAFNTTITNVGTTINAENTSLQSIADMVKTTQAATNSGVQTVNSSGQTSAQQTASAQLTSILGILNTQVGSNYLFSGGATNTPSVADADTILNGTTTQAGLSQFITQRQQADGAGATGRLVVASPAPTTVSVAEDVAGSPFGLKLGSVSSTLTGATVTGPTGSPAGISVSLGASNPNNGDQVGFTFNLPDGTTQTIQLTASTATPPPAISVSTPAGTQSSVTGAATNTNGSGAPAITSSTLIYAAAGGTSATTVGLTTQAATKFADGDTFTINGKTVTVKAAATPIAASVPNGSALVTGTNIVTDGSGNSTVYLNAGTSVGDVLSAFDLASGVQRIGTIASGAATASAASGQTVSSVSASGQVVLKSPTGTNLNITGNVDDLAALGLTTTTAPAPANTFAIDPTSSANTATNLKIALNAAIGTLAGTALVAASSLTASNEFFNWSSTATGSAVQNQASTAASVTGATLLSGTAPSDSISASFAAGDTITVNGTAITFVASGAAGNQLNVTDSVQALLNKIDSITGSGTRSTISNGVITISGGTAPSVAGGSAPNLTLSSSNTAALAALGFAAPVNATPAPLRINGSPPSSATSLVAGTSANTVFWYTGDTGPGSARASQTARIDQSQTVQFGIRANEPAITSLLTTIGAFAATIISPTGTNANGIVSALNLRVTTALTTQSGQQTVADIQADLAQAQVTMKDAGTRQTQASATLQNLVSQTETISSDQVASELLALQNELQASYQTTSMLSQLTLTKYLPAG